jgi:hypothetical protein
VNPLPHHHGDQVALNIVQRLTDDSVHMRRWLICSGCAAYLAAQLGTPHLEVLVPADQVSHVENMLDNQPGVIICERDQ